MASDQGQRSGLRDRIQELITGGSDAADCGYGVICVDPENMNENFMDTIKSLLGTSRNSVVMVRINEESLAKLDQLVEAGVVSSRSEAAAYLIGEGIGARKDLFDKISEKVDEIRKVKEELKDLLENA